MLTVTRKKACAGMPFSFPDSKKNDAVPLKSFSTPACSGHRKVAVAI